MMAVACSPIKEEVNNSFSASRGMENIAHVFDDDCLGYDAFLEMDYSNEANIESATATNDSNTAVPSSSPEQTASILTKPHDSQGYASSEFAATCTPTTTATASDETLHSSNHKGLLVAPTNLSDDGYVNVFLVIDPKSKTCLLPMQLISYKDPNNVVSNMVYGPKLLDSLPSGILPSITTSNAKISPMHGDDATIAHKSFGSSECSQPFVPECTSIQNSTSAHVCSSSETYRPPTLMSSQCQPSQLQPITDSVSSQDHSFNQSTQRNSTDPSSSATTDHPPTMPLPPLRALSAYNFFFRDERERILNGIEADWSESKQQRLLEEHWYQDRNKKRRHRKTHGKIDFTSLSKLISARWKELPESRKDFYRQVASRDFSRFKEESKARGSNNDNSLEEHETMDHEPNHSSDNMERGDATWKNASCEATGLAPDEGNT